jgi:hypothetical protein
MGANISDPPRLGVGQREKCASPAGPSPKEIEPAFADIRKAAARGDHQQPNGGVDLIVVASGLEL